MPKIHLCRRCKDTIKPDDDYVDLDDGSGKVLHARCYGELISEKQSQQKSTDDRGQDYG